MLDASDREGRRMILTTARFQTLADNPTTPLRAVSHARGQMGKARVALSVARCKQAHPANPHRDAGDAS